MLNGIGYTLKRKRLSSNSDLKHDEPGHFLGTYSFVALTVQLTLLWLAQNRSDCVTLFGFASSAAEAQLLICM